MDIVYFPFTFISEQDCRIVSACFDQWSVWMPSTFRIPPHMQKLADNNLLSIEFPFDTHDTFMAPMLEQLEHWANTHGHGQLRHRLGHSDDHNKPTESSVYRILDAINTDVTQQPGSVEASKNGDAVTAEEKSIQQRRLFLQVAQAFDQHEQAIQNGMEKVTSLENSFQEIIHAVPQGTHWSDRRQTIMESDQSNQTYMLSERLEAWLCFFKAPGLKHYRNTSHVYVTASSAIEKLLVDALPAAPRVTTIDRIPVNLYEDTNGPQWRQSFYQALKQWMEKADGDALIKPQPPKTAPENPTVSISFYRVNMSLDQWIGLALEAGPSSDIEQNASDAGHSTIIACVKNE